MNRETMKAPNSTFNYKQQWKARQLASFYFVTNKDAEHL